MALRYIHKGNLKLASNPHFEHENLLYFHATNKGGFSEGNYASLNLGLNTLDNIETVGKNYSTFYESIGISPSQLILPTQAHTDHIVHITPAFLQLTTGQRKQALQSCDATITNMPQVILGVLTADCAPILFHDPVCNVVAIAHSGWRGTVKGIAINVIENMVRHYACSKKNIKIGVGPTISGKHYEVGDEVLLAFKQTFTLAHYNKFVNNTTNSKYINIVKAITLSLKNKGIPRSNICISDTCTFESNDFFSYRKHTGNTGRFISCIGLNK